MSLKILLSPAKKLNFEQELEGFDYAEPILWKSTEKLSKELKKLSVKKIANLMDLSLDLAQLNYKRYQEFQTTQTSLISKPAVFVFNGEVYNGLKANEFNLSDLEFAQKNLRILSGLYGLLKPLDFIQPYRLEMGTSLAVGKNKNLYEFWGSTITKVFQQDLNNEDVVVNLASNEYFKAIKSKDIKNRIVTPLFKEFKNGEYKTVMVFAKNARGTMAKWIIKNKIQNVEELQTFCENGYQFNPALSSQNEWVFAR